MAKQKTESVVLDRMTKARLGPVFEVPLDQIKVDPQRFRHRDGADLGEKKASMKDLMGNLTTEGQKDPLIVYKGVDGTWHLVGGHRRREAMLLLAEAKAKGFTHGMLVKVREILDGEPHDYLVMSVADNLFQERIDEVHRVKAAVCLLDEGVDHVRIKINLKLSDSTFDRCRRLAESPWMLGHVEAGEVGLTDAHLLLEAAGGKGGRVALDNLKKDLAREVAAVNATIAAKEAELAARNKEIKKADATVKNYFPSHLVKAWVQALKRGERLQRKARFLYGAAIEKDKVGRKLVIPAVGGVYLIDSELERLAEITMRLDRLVKDLRPQVNALARQRAALGVQESDDGPADFEAAGLDAVADVLNPRHEPMEVEEFERQAALAEANEHWDREDRRRVIPATAGVVIADEQPVDGDDDIEGEGR